MSSCTRLHRPARKTRSRSPACGSTTTAGIVLGLAASCSACARPARSPSTTGRSPIMSSRSLPAGSRSHALHDLLGWVPGRGCQARASWIVISSSSTACCPAARTRPSPCRRRRCGPGEAAALATLGMVGIFRLQSRSIDRLRVARRRLDAARPWSTLSSAITCARWVGKQRIVGVVAPASLVGGRRWPRCCCRISRRSGLQRVDRGLGGAQLALQLLRKMNVDQVEATGEELVSGAAFGISSALVEEARPARILDARIAGKLTSPIGPSSAHPGGVRIASTALSGEHGAPPCGAAARWRRRRRAASRRRRSAGCEVAKLDAGDRSARPGAGDQAAMLSRRLPPGAVRPVVTYGGRWREKYSRRSRACSSSLRRGAPSPRTTRTPSLNAESWWHQFWPRMIR